MSVKIYTSHKIYAAASPIHGFGVFATQTIQPFEVIEETPIHDLGIKKGGENDFCMSKYRYNWPSNGGDWEKQVLAWGFGSLYNHSKTPNAFWRSNPDRGTFLFFALKRIEKDEEILIRYGGDQYWEDLEYFGQFPKEKLI